MLEVTDARYIADYRIWIAFNDGACGVVNLEDSLWGPAFEPLRDLASFRQFVVSSILHTLAWPNDADFAPEYLRQKLSDQAFVTPPAP